MTTATHTGSARTVHVEHCMGTVFSIDIRDPGNWTDAIGDVVAWLHHVDTVFSTYQPGSDLSRIRREELRVPNAHPDVAVVLDLCAEAQIATDGYFTAVIDRAIDPTGLVKGWAIERTSALLRQHGSDNHAVNGGGDIQLAGESAAGQPWRVGIANPAIAGSVCAVVVGRDFAVATSGTSERGVHIVNPRTGGIPSGYLSATVVGRSLTHADAYATAAFAMGSDATRWAPTVEDFEVMLVGSDGATSVSPGWHRYVQGRRPA